MSNKNSGLKTPAWLGKGNDQVAPARVTKQNPDGTTTYVTRANERRTIRTDGKVYRLGPNTTATVGTPAAPANEPPYMTALRAFVQKFKKKPNNGQVTGVRG